MTHKRSEPNKTVLVAWVLIAAAVLSEVAYGQSALTNHPVFAKYPSRGEIQQRVGQFKREHADAFEVARQDFDLAVRSNLDLRWPGLIRGEPIIIRKWPLRVVGFRSGYEYKLAGVQKKAASFSQKEVRKQGRAKKWVAFYRDHIDELAVEPSPALRMVAVDVILNGWDDWSEWTTDRLKGYRERFPDIYRIVAVNLIGQMNHELSQRRRRGEPTADFEVEERLGADGVFLRMLMETEASHELQRGVIGQVTRIRADLDALDFVVKLALEGESRKDRLSNGLSCMGSLTESLPIGQQRDFWVRYLDSDDDSVRSYAVSRVGITIDLLKKDPKEKAINDQLAERLRQIAADDPDSWIRTKADRGVKTYEDDSPPRGLIDYGKSKKDD